MAVVTLLEPQKTYLQVDRVNYLGQKQSDGSNSDTYAHQTKNWHSWLDIIPPQENGSRSRNSETALCDS